VVRRGATPAIGVAAEPAAALREYASVPIAFTVRSVLDIAEPAAAAEGFVLTERRLDVPYVKDYDAIPREHPAGWAERFDVSRWGVFAAWVEGRRVGGAVVAFRTPGLTMPEGRDDLAVLWDIRVAPEARGQGVGSVLFRAAEVWARGHGCRQLKVETQNVNVAACRFYARQGCALASIHRDAYPGMPGEIQLLWYKDLAGVALGSHTRQS
jgi:GNAT superfamily N-acetyltransferase